MATQYGAFRDDQRAFLINTPQPPRPWINYLSNGRYCSLISQVGGGFSFYLDHRHHGVLRREMRQATDDLPARLWYLREGDECWTVNAHPINRFDSFEAAHSFGRTSLRSSCKEVLAAAEWFVGPEVDGEFAVLTLTNTSARERTLSLFSYQEFILGSFDEDSRERTFAQLFIQARRTGQTIDFVSDRWSLTDDFRGNSIWPYRVYVTTDTPPAGLTADRNAFIGQSCTPVQPKLFAEGGDLGEFDERRGVDPAAVFQWNLTLAPGESQTIRLLTAIQPRADAVPAALSPDLCESQSQACTAYWDGIMNTLTVETPDRELNCFVNYWNKYQMLINNWFGRGPSYFHKGQYPAMRDCCQDSFGVLPLIPGETRDKLLRVFSFMFRDGRIGAGCNRVVYDENPTDKADLALWMVLTLKMYLLETGDESILDETLPFLDGGESSVYEHILTGVQRVIDQRGEHGLPLLWNGDWNDALDMAGDKGKGESIWLAQFLYYSLNELVYILEKKNDQARIETYQTVADELRENLEACHWDGEWFLRAFDDQGRKLGTQTEDDAFIYLNTQTWAVIPGLGTDDQRRQAMAAVDRYLETEFGLANLYPPYDAFNPDIGIISQFVAGHKENGAVFSHATAFHLIARALVGDAEGFYRIYRKSLPCTRDQDQYQAEPYVYSQFCAAKPSPHYGEGAYHWLTGTAAWMFRAVTDYMLGVQPTDDGLRLNPCLPPGFTSYRMVRRFRDAVYHITVDNPEDRRTGTPQITVDDEAVDGPVIPLQPAGAECRVQVTLNG